MLRVGLTGGIGSGKSTAARLFAELGVPVIDADDIAREVVAPGTAGMAQVVGAFGREVVDTEGKLDRVWLRRQVFADPSQRQRLERILHPLIRETMVRRAASFSAPYLLFVIPLLVEKGWGVLVDRVLVVDCPEADQVERVHHRDGIPEDQVRAIMATQASRGRRLAAADDVIHNDGKLEQLAEQVRVLHGQYLALAGHS